LYDEIKYNEVGGTSSAHGQLMSAYNQKLWNLYTMIFIHHKISFHFSFASFKFFVPIKSLICRERFDDLLGNIERSPADVNKMAEISVSKQYFVFKVIKMVR
jgi:hypothetical protein